MQGRRRAVLCRRTAAVAGAQYLAPHLSAASRTAHRLRGLRRARDRWWSPAWSRSAREHRRHWGRRGRSRRRTISSCRCTSPGRSRPDRSATSRRWRDDCARRRSTRATRRCMAEAAAHRSAASVTSTAIICCSTVRRRVRRSSKARWSSLGFKPAAPNSTFSRTSWRRFSTAARRSRRNGTPNADTRAHACRRPSTASIPAKRHTVDPRARSQRTGSMACRCSRAIDWPQAGARRSCGRTRTNSCRRRGSSSAMCSLPNARSRSHACRATC